MRTDSTNLSELAIKDISSAITKEYGSDFVKVRHYHTSSKGAQEAHEAIRPTYVSNTSIPGTSQEQRLYELIWKRAVASQMSDALLEKTNVEIAVSGSADGFKAEGEVVKFEGFMKAWRIDAESASFTRLPALSEGEVLKAGEITATQRFTLPPARFTEATLVKR